MKRNAIVRIVLYAMIAVLMVWILIAGISHKKYALPGIVVKRGSDAPQVHENTFNFRDIDSLEVDWIAGDITIIPADTNEISVTEELSADQKSMVLKQGGSALYVEYCEDDFAFSLGSTGSKNLNITVPREWLCQELEINAASANLRAESLVIQKVRASTASGTLRFENCAVDTIKMDTASGDLDFSGALNELKFDSASAHANLILTNHPKSIKLDSLSGDLDLTLPKGCGFTLDKDSLSGSCIIEQDTTDRDGKLTHGDGACEIEVDGLSASLNIRQG